ncbi:MAG: DNA polymerase [Planctomycetota bacterium]|jgi:hypothetical protein
MSFRNILNRIGSVVKSGSDLLVSGVKKGANLTSRALQKIGDASYRSAEFFADTILPTRVSKAGKDLFNKFNPFVGLSPEESLQTIQEELKPEPEPKPEPKEVFGPLPPGFVEIEEPVPNGFVEYILEDGKSVWRRTDQRLFDLIDKKITSPNKSDAMTLTLDSDIGIPRRFVKRINKKPKSTENEGAWFPYLLKDEVPMDLTRYGIFKKDQLPREVNNCLLHIFEDHPNYENLASIHHGNFTAQSELKSICSLLGVRIKLYKYRTELRRCIEYGDKSLGEEHTYHIALACNHYFKFEVTSYKSQWVKKAAWSKPDKFVDIRKTSPFINSLQLVVEIFKQKDLYLDEFGSEIYDLHYQSKYDVNVEKPKFDFSRDFKKCEIEEPKGPRDDDEGYSNIFYADIETNTTGNHEPYMFCLIEESTDERRCWRGSDCVDRALNRLSYFKRPLVYFHNLGYDSKFIVDKLANPNTVDISVSNCVSLTGYRGKTKISFHDTYAFLSCPLSSFSKMFDLDEGKYENFPHSIFSKKSVTDANEIKLTPRLRKIIPSEYHIVDKKMVRHMDYAEDYCVRDVETLKNGFMMFKKWIKNELDINVDYLLTSASLAHHYLKLQGCYEDVYQVGGVTRAYMQKAVVGGRTMISLDDQYRKVVKKCTEDIYDFDAVSLYPSAMMRMSGSPKGPPKELDSCDLTSSSLDKFDDYFVTIRITKVGRKSKLPCMSKLAEDGSRIWTNDMVGEITVVNKIMLEDYIKFHRIEFDVLAGIKFDEGFNNKLVETMKNMFELRLKLKKEKNPAEKVYKLIMNSAYGKTIEKAHNIMTKYVVKNKFKEFMVKKSGSVREVYEMDNHFRIKHEVGIKGHFTLPHIGCSVLAMSKRIMNEVFDVVEDDVYYTDTDSMFVTRNGLDKLRKTHPHLIGSRPQQFHVDFEMEGEGVKGVKALFLAPKTYCVELVNDDGKVDYHLRMKGISKNAIDAKITEFDSPYHMFEKLTQQELKFNLLAGDRVRFEFSGDLKVKNVKDFERTVGPFRTNV